MKLRFLKHTDSPFFIPRQLPPPRSSLTRAASGINLFEVADDANVTISDFSATVSDDAKAEVSSIIKINNGSLSIQDGFTVTTGTVAIEIGESATSAGNISGDLSSLTVTVNENNTNAGNIANEVADKTGATVDVGGTPVNEKYVAINTETYEGFETLHEAFNSVPEEGTASFKLVNDTIVNAPGGKEEDGRLFISNKTISLDLNGYTISAGEMKKIHSGFFFINKNGNFILNDSSADHTGTIDLTKTGENDYIVSSGIAVFPGKNEKASLTVNGGTIKANIFAIVGNGSYGTDAETTIDIKDGYFESLYGTTIYHPQNGTMTINGGTFVGENTAIEIRSGNLLVNNGSFTANASPTNVGENGNGTTSTGSAIAIAQHTTKLPITVTITDGEFNGYSAIYESNPQKNTEEDLAKIFIDIEGGTFNATNGGTAVIYSEDKTGFISGGTFNTEPNSDYIADGYHVVESGSNWTVLAD